MAEHHLARKNHGAGVDLVQIGIPVRRVINRTSRDRVLGGSAVGSLEDGVARLVIDVASRGNANATNLRRKSIAEVIAVKVHGGNDVKLLGAALLSKTVTES
jgi:hypothetical protein